jgi:DNA invertase Pin-like site-specific DNA recombinase
MNDMQSRTTNKTVAYLRVASGDVVTGKARLECQLRACEEYARLLGCRVTRAYADLGVSGMSDRRPALTQLLRDLSRGEIGRVVVTDSARLARSPELARWLQERIRSNGAILAVSYLPTRKIANSQRKRGR